MGRNECRAWCALSWVMCMWGASTVDTLDAFSTAALLCDALATKMSEGEVALLRAKLEASELRHEVQRLQGVVKQYQRELEESNRLLRKQRLPPKPHANATEKALIAASQRFVCAGGEGCPLKVLNGGVFDSSLWEIDHIEPYSRSGKHVGNRQATCPYCHSVKTRAEIASRQHRLVELEEDSDSDEA